MSASFWFFLPPFFFWGGGESSHKQVAYICSLLFVYSLSSFTLKYLITHQKYYKASCFPYCLLNVVFFFHINRQASLPSISAEHFASSVQKGPYSEIYKYSFHNANPTLTNKQAFVTNGVHIYCSTYFLVASCALSTLTTIFCSSIRKARTILKHTNRSSYFVITVNVKMQFVEKQVSSHLITGLN